ncbi:MAG TPA: nicotinate-nicotinamide nucleotide adenylyltransferase [Planctomycetota bacterium]|nr:nicotinate-nicotinamide nucleotide adenylyltransferase [Planctomycetota bacterium]
MRIALFGGSFDPPHLGHVLAAAYAYVAAPIDAVWVLPARVHPYAKDLAPYAQRRALCDAAFGRLPFVQVRDDELGNPNGFTVDLVERLAATHPSHRWSLIGGTDTGTDLPRWHRGDELAKLVEVIVVPRRGYDDGHPAALPEISSTSVRAALTRGEDITTMVPPAVAELIRNNGWYR